MSWGVEGINYPQEGIFEIAFFFLSSMNVIESPTFVFAAFHSYKGMICTWHFVFLRSCAAEWFDIRVCCGMITEIRIIDTPITSHPGHRELSCVCVCVWDKTNAQQLPSIQYHIINRLHHGVHWLLKTSSSYNWKCASFVLYVTPCGILRKDSLWKGWCLKLAGKLWKQWRHVGFLTSVPQNVQLSGWIFSPVKSPLKTETRTMK